LGEIRGGEAFDILQPLNTGHSLPRGCRLVLFFDW
jgi:Flp pilus assembly CpaF family ATPase